MNTKRLLRRLGVMPILAMAVLGFASGTADAAPAAYTCTGGSVPAGTYASLSITGDCVVDAGTVTVTGSVSVGPTGAARFAVDPEARLVVKGSLTANGAGAVSLACYAFSSPICVTVAGNVSVSRASYAVLSGIAVGGNVAVTGTTDDCQSFFSITAVGFNTIRGNVTVAGNTTCVVNILQNDVSGSMTVTNNTALNTFDRNSLVQLNTIKGNLTCAGNTAAGPSTDPIPNDVKGRTTGDCTFAVNGS